MCLMLNHVSVMFKLMSVTNQPVQFQSMLLIFFNQCSVTNPVHGLPLTRHQRSLAHHMDSCTTPTVALNLRLQFPSSIGLTIHTADCTDHNLHKPWTLCRVLYCMYPSDSFSTEPTQLFYSCLVCFLMF